MKRMTTVLLGGLMACPLSGAGVADEPAATAADDKVTIQVESAESGDDLTTNDQNGQVEAATEKSIEIITVTEEEKEAVAAPAKQKQAKKFSQTQKPGEVQKRAFSYTLQSTKTSDSKDGEQRFQGRLVVVGPDGERKEYDLSKELPEGLNIFRVEGSPLKSGGPAEDHHNRIRVLVQKLQSTGDKADEDGSVDVEIESEQVERLMIGVQCAEADELLRSHLKLSEGALVVEDVVEDSPAAEAGILKNDVLLKSGESQLKTISDLLKCVQDSEGKELTIQLIRQGNPMEIKVTPRAMKEPAEIVVTGPKSDESEIEDKVFRILENSPVGEWKESPRPMIRHFPGLRWNQVHPGIVIDKGSSLADVERLLKAAAEAAEKAEAKAEAASKKAEGLTGDSSEKLRRQLEKVEQELKAMSARIAELEEKR